MTNAYVLSLKVQSVILFSGSKQLTPKKKRKIKFKYLLK